MKNKINIIFYVIIAVLIIVAGLEGIYILNNKCKICNNTTEEKIVYKGTRFLRENIEFDVPEEFTIEAHNLNYDDNLVLEIKSTKSVLKASGKVEYYDSNNNLIREDEINIESLPKDRSYIKVFTYPKLNVGVYSGKIKVSIKAEYDDKLEYLDDKLLDLTSNATKNDTTKETTITMSGKNPYENISLIAGFILLYKNDELIAINYAVCTPEGENITISSTFQPLPKDNELDFVEYDDIKLVVNTLV